LGGEEKKESRPEPATRTSFSQLSLGQKPLKRNARPFFTPLGWLKEEKKGFYTQVKRSTREKTSRFLLDTKKKGKRGGGTGFGWVFCEGGGEKGGILPTIAKGGPGKKKKEKRVFFGPGSGRPPLGGGGEGTVRWISIGPGGEKTREGGDLV